MTNTLSSLTVPILQGGMGVGVSLGGLAGAVAACGGMGTISTADVGYREADFRKNSMEANLRALTKEIHKAKELSKGCGMVAINAMVATKQFADAVKTAVAAGVDAVVSGAGLPLALPSLTEGSRTAIAPIVSSGRACQLILKTWDRKYHITADFIVIEGSKAGGHLGFSEKELLENTCQPLTDILTDVLAVIKPYEERYGHPIPVFVGGGVFDGKDMATYTKLGAAGVQIGTRFIATEECDAGEDYKKVYLAAKAEDVTLLKSPVGLPGRAILTPLLKRLQQEKRIAPTYCAQCITGCKPSEIPFCITHALIEAVKGNYEEGLFFTGTNVGRIDRILTVRQLMDTLQQEWRQSR